METRAQIAPGCPTSPAKLVAGLKGHTDGITALAFTPDRCTLSSGSRDGTVRLWNIASSKPGERALIRKNSERFNSLVFSADGRMMAAGSGSLNGLVWLFDVSDKVPRETAVLRGARGAIDALAFSPDGKMVAGAGEDRTLRVWEPAPGFSGDSRIVLTGHTQPVKAVAFAPDGKGLATAGKDATVRLWTLGRIRSWERLSLPHEQEVHSIAFTPDGKTLATAGQDGVIRMWDLTAAKPVVRTELTGHTGAVRLIAITPDAAILVSVGDGNRIINWDLQRGKQVREWNLPDGAAQGVALTPDGRYLSRGTTGGTVELYRVAEKRS